MHDSVIQNRTQKVLARLAMIVSFVALWGK